MVYSSPFNRWMFQQTGEKVVWMVGCFYWMGEQVVETARCFYQMDEQVIQMAGRFYRAGDQAVRTDATIFEWITQVVRMDANFFHTASKQNSIWKQKAINAHFPMEGVKGGNFFQVVIFKCHKPLTRMIKKVSKVCLNYHLCRHMESRREFWSSQISHFLLISKSLFCFKFLNLIAISIAIGSHLAWLYCVIGALGNLESTGLDFWCHLQSATKLLTHSPFWPPISSLLSLFTLPACLFNPSPPQTMLCHNCYDLAE